LVLGNGEAEVVGFESGVAKVLEGGSDGVDFRGGELLSLILRIIFVWVASWVRLFGGRIGVRVAGEFAGVWRE
jgi:hypothetical protein